MATTPGPWTYDRYNEFWFAVRGKDSNPAIGENVCSVWHDNEDDARLITAAPEMLEECQKMLKDLLAFRQEVVDHDMICPLWVNDHIDDLEMLIAKIEGKDG